TGAPGEQRSPPAVWARVRVRGGACPGTGSDCVPGRGLSVCASGRCERSGGRGGWLSCPRSERRRRPKSRTASFERRPTSSGSSLVAVHRGAVIVRGTLAVLVIVPVPAFTVRVAGPFWTISVVALTGMKPSSVTDAVAGGRVSVDEDVPVVRSTVEDRVPSTR